MKNGNYVICMDVNSKTKIARSLFKNNGVAIRISPKYGIFNG